jgi:hypothetical protein
VGASDCKMPEPAASVSASVVKRLIYVEPAIYWNCVCSFVFDTAFHHRVHAHMDLHVRAALAWDFGVLLNALPLTCGTRSYQC